MAVARWRTPARDVPCLTRPWTSGGTSTSARSAPAASAAPRGSAASSCSHAGPSRWRASRWFADRPELHFSLLFVYFTLHPEVGDVLQVSTYSPWAFQKNLVDLDCAGGMPRQSMPALPRQSHCKCGVDHTCDPGEHMACPVHRATASSGAGVWHVLWRVFAVCGAACACSRHRFHDQAHSRVAVPLPSCPTAGVSKCGWHGELLCRLLRIHLGPFGP